MPYTGIYNMMLQYYSLLYRQEKVYSLFSLKFILSFWGEKFQKAIGKCCWCQKFGSFLVDAFLSDSIRMLCVGFLDQHSLAS